MPTGVASQCFELLATIKNAKIYSRHFPATIGKNYILSTKTYAKYGSSREGPNTVTSCYNSSNQTICINEKPYKTQATSFVNNIY